MKRVFIFLGAVLLTACVVAQNTPQKMSYQAVIRDGSNNLIASQAIGMRVSILQNTTAVYVETHATTTNANGLVTIEIGTGTTSDDFSTIDWTLGSYSIKTETDPEGGVNYTAIVGTSPLLSVPYALHTKTAEEIQNPLWFSNTEGINSDGIVGIGTSFPEANLHINDNTGISLLTMESDDNIYTLWKSNRSGVDDYLVGIDGGNNRFMFANLANSQILLTLNGNYVGISQPNPQANLDVSGSLKLSTGSEGSGKVLTSDYEGNANWETPVMSYNDLTDKPSITDSIYTYVDGSETKLIAGININITGNGTIIAPYSVNVKKSTFYIGQDTLGGIVYCLYLDQSGNQHGLIVSKTESTSQWQTANSTTNADRSWDGAYNTSLMTNSPAATYVTGLGAGWYLPSIDELSLLYHARFHANKALNDGGYTRLSNTANYWSSTESAENGAWFFQFTYASAAYTFKTDTYSVRAVRAF